MKYKIKIKGSGEFFIISSEILHLLIKEVHKSKQPELAVLVDDLIPEPYKNYVVNVINSNRENDYFRFSDILENPITKKQLYQIVEGQMKQLDMDNEKCFQQVCLVEKKGNLMEINCTQPFWIACQDSEAVFLYQYANGQEETIAIEIPKDNRK